MKSLVFLCFVAVIGCVYSRPGPDPVPHIRQIVENYGYEFKNYSVKTEDGYILDLFRLPQGRKANNNQDSSSSEENSSGSSKQNDSNRPAVLLMHNFLSSSDDFIMPGPDAGLAYYLADRGYDVYVGNSRGNRYGRRHTSLNPNRDSAFWNFCWHEIGVKDLPAIVDKVIEISGEPKIYYAGHMEGSTIFYVLTSERPEYNQKFYKAASLGPFAYISHSENAMFKQISDNFNSKEWIMKNLGANRFVPSAELLNNGGKQECVRRGKNENLCENVYFLFFGYDDQYFNMTTIDMMMPTLPSGGSSKQVLHYARIFKTGKFVRSFEEEQEEYDLSKISTPMAFFYVPDDYVVPEEDVQYLKNKMPNVEKEYKFQELSNNIDLLYAKNVDRIVYEKIVSYFRKSSERKSH